MVSSQYWFPLISSEHLTVAAEFIKCPLSSCYCYDVLTFIFGVLCIVSLQASLCSFFGSHVPGRMASSSCTCRISLLRAPCPVPVLCSKLLPCPLLLRATSLQRHFQRGLFGWPPQKHRLATFSQIKPFSFRPCVIICNYIHACAYLVNVCLLREDWSSMSGCPVCGSDCTSGTSQRAWCSAVILTCMAHRAHSVDQVLFFVLQCMISLFLQQPDQVGLSTLQSSKPANRDLSRLLIGKCQSWDLNSNPFLYSRHYI